MTLREQNPFIESDLELIITTFEKGILKSRDSDSVVLPFRRDLESMSALPKSVKDAIDRVANTTSPEDAAGEEEVPRVPQTDDISPEEISSSEEEEESLKEKVEDWVDECIPCDFRIFTDLDAEFFADIGDEWEKAFDKTLENLKDLDNLLEDVDISEPLCSLGNMFKFHCTPDIKKMIKILEMFMDQMEFETGLNMGIFDSYLEQLLQPIFNELISNLDIIDELALGPIRCVLDQIQKQINQGPQLAVDLYEATRSQAQASGQQLLNQSRRQRREARDQADALLDNIETPDRTGNQGSSSSSGGAQDMADRARRETTSAQQRTEQRTESSMGRVNNFMEQADHTLSFLERFKEYLKTAYNWLKDKKDQLLDWLKDLVENGLDRWNDRVNFSNGKKDLLTQISIMKALIETVSNGGLTCGPESNSMTQEEFETLVSFYVHPSESLEVSVDDGNIVVRRADPPSSGYGEIDGTILNVDGPDAIQTEIENIVSRRPIATCIKKVTDDESAQVERWIKQLEAVA